MARKVFLSILGTGFYEPTIYYSGDNKATKNRFIQAASLELTCKNWDEHDAGYVFVTKQARQYNWEEQPDGKRKKFGAESQEYHGLKYEINQLNLPFTIEPIEIVDGKDETEMWHVFSSIYDVLQYDDELYIDLTHAFRYLPMLMLVLTQYAKLLKKTKVVSITYGNFEARDRENNSSPIVDLTSLVQLQDWNCAVDTFLRTGNTTQISEIHDPIVKQRKRIAAETLGKDIEATNLKQFTDSLIKLYKQITTCQGKDLIEAKQIKLVKENLDIFKKTENVIVPLKNLTLSIENIVDRFDSKCNVINPLIAANLSFEFGLYQQCITYILEGIISYFCHRNGLDYGNEKERDIVRDAFVIISQEREGKKPECSNQVQQIVNDEEAQQCANLVKNAIDIRNQYNHGGMKSNKQFDQNVIIERIKKCNEELTEFINNYSKNLSSSALPPLFINLSNHPSSAWAKEQKNAAGQLGDIRDITFPEVEPDATEEDVNLLAQQTAAPIFELAKDHEVTVHIMGEMTLTYQLVQLLKTHGITCLASTTERIVSTDEQGNKVSTFRFNQFRKY